MVILRKRLDWKYKVNFEIYDTTTWLTNNIAIDILPNISPSKGNQIIKLGPLMGYNKIFFFKSYTEYEAGRLVPDLFSFFKKA